MKICKILFLFSSLLMFVQCGDGGGGGGSTAPTSGSTSPSSSTAGATGTSANVFSDPCFQEYCSTFESLLNNPQNLNQSLNIPSGATIKGIKVWPQASSSGYWPYTFDANELHQQGCVQYKNSSLPSFRCPSSYVLSSIDTFTSRQCPGSYQVCYSGGTTGSGSTTGTTTTIGGGPSTDLTCAVYDPSHALLQNDTSVSADYYSWSWIKTVSVDLKQEMSSTSFPFSPQANVTVILNRGAPISQNFTIDTQAGQLPISPTGVYVTTVAVNRIPIITVGLIQLPTTSQVSIKVKLYSQSNPPSLLREVECKNY